jgi:hypothetical protein
MEVSGQLHTQEKEPPVMGWVGPDPVLDYVSKKVK